MTIYQGLIEAQADILKAIASFIDHFHNEVTTLSAPEIHALFDHMHARHAGNHSFLAAIRQGTTSARLESFMERDPTHLLQSFFNRLPAHQTGIDRSSTCPTQLESEVNQIRQDLQTHMIDTASNPALMLNFKSEVTSIPTINLTGEEANIHYPPPRGNIVWDPEDNLDAFTAAPGHSIHQHGAHDESFSSIAPPHTGSPVALAVPSTSGLQSIPTASLIIDKKTFFPRFINRVKALMSKENRAHILITVGMEEAATCFNAPTSQDEESYDGDVSKVDEEDAEVIPDEDDTQIKTSKSAEDNMFPDNEGQEETNKEDGNQTAKPGDKKPV